MISIFAMIYCIAWLPDFLVVAIPLADLGVQKLKIWVIAVPYFSASWCPPSWFIKSTDCDIYH